MTPLLEVENLKKYFPVYKGFFKRVAGYYKAVDGVSFSINAGETFGLVGESGCGKTTVGKSILRLIEPTDGRIVLHGDDIRLMSKEQLRRERRNMQIIFQDPYGSLNPRMTIEEIIAEPILKHDIAKGAECVQAVKRLLSEVGLSEKEMHKYPHEFSGGQRQRIVIARALSVHPKLIVCDEPVSALDVSVQAQILNLMQDLQQQYGIAYLFIAHGMPVVQHISDRVGVMYLGKIVEVADAVEIFSNSLHPYSKALMSAVPEPDPTLKQKRVVLSGEVPNLSAPPPGCLFSSRCAYCQERCKKEIPELKQIAPNHQVACHLF